MPHGRSIHLQLLILTSDTSFLSNTGSVGDCDDFVMIFKRGLKKMNKDLLVVCKVDAKQPTFGLVNYFLPELPRRLIVVEVCYCKHVDLTH